MQYEFLRHFPRRMKNVGLYAVLVQNSLQKTTWKQHGFQKTDEQFNMIFAVMLYIMEQSLKEENCTMDDIGAYIDTVNVQYFKKDMTYDSCRALGDFIVNVILSNEGRVMHFDGYDFEENTYQSMHISYVANKIVYIDHDFKRTSYYLTDDGYNLLLSTLEIENNMKLTIHEMIFQMHLEKQSYDKAVDEIKNVFNLLRIQIQKIQEAMGRIRRNALNYSVRDYEQILHENLDTIDDTKKKFQNYREMVKSRVQELEETNINVKRLSEKEEEKLKHLREIEQYLNRTIDEHQKILGSHLDLKALYTKELENLTQMSLIKRFSFRTEIYDKLLENPSALERLEYFLRPLFNQDAEKGYNLNKAFQLQRPVRRQMEEDAGEQLDFDEEKWQQEQERLRRERLERYEQSLACLLGMAIRGDKGEITLKEAGMQVKEDLETRDFLIPNVEIFKEIMVELIKNREMELSVLKKERSQFIQDRQGEFQLNEMLLQLADERPEFENVERIEVCRLEDGGTVEFEGILNEEGERRKIRCSNVRIHVETKG
ncbi:MAG: hypothetical protein HFH15_04170 [Ruminococcus sp.]|jgi:hypothetical protein|nr:hypothetical protein [Ruminococcus sp.]